MSTTQPESTDATLVAETVEFCSRLIQFDTSNFGGGDSRGERAAAEWVAERLTEAGYAPVVLESAPGRASTVVRIPGTDPDAPALLVHGHLDVVPAEAADWSYDPFCGEVRDGAVWGRGALDMKDMDAMMLAAVRSFARTGFVPPRDIVLAFVADEEDTGDYGAGFLVREHAELFEGVRTAIGESGGYAVHLPDGSRLYPIAAGERGSAWMNLIARGRAGHGSRPNPDNAVARLAAALTRLAGYTWPVHLTPTVAALLDGLTAHLGVTVDLSDPASLDQLGDAANLIRSTISNSLNPTMLSAGYKHNVIPSQAVAGVDGRILPGAEEAFFSTVDELVGEGVTREFASYAAPVAAGHTTPEFAAMAAALRVYDPGALVLPFCMAGGTDAKAFSTLGIACYGFAPGTTPPGFAHNEYVHGVDERVLVDSLAFGVRVLERYLRTAPDPAP
ncbi:M20/M25/M40 family metallo-hydrolase [Planosporangium thailandense]|uniref:M20/M25/M40 family metallo-hydrolase n=1 Tax=Planosporangium thailandense TaxID=765197 RepID=A0ABX0Y9H1_9ACTN|nr:M20/M25/M40 family metallo-hydrolase [Planosporangium thailandense]NJC74060.1 M20/M25/M40 family metallo-hydrolase [Planosporangium thailandense]